MPKYDAESIAAPLLVLVIGLLFIVIEMSLERRRQHRRDWATRSFYITASLITSAALVAAVLIGYLATADRYWSQASKLSALLFTVVFQTIIMVYPLSTAIGKWKQILVIAEIPTTLFIVLGTWQWFVSSDEWLWAAPAINQVATTTCAYYLSRCGPSIKRRFLFLTTASGITTVASVAFILAYLYRQPAPYLCLQCSGAILLCFERIVWKLTDRKSQQRDFFSFLGGGPVNTSGAEESTDLPLSQLESQTSTTELRHPKEYEVDSADLQCPKPSAWLKRSSRQAAMGPNLAESPSRFLA